MASSSILLLICAVLCSVSLVRRVHAYYRLSHIDGPPLAAWTRLWMAWLYFSGRNHTILYEAIENYGPLVRVGPNTIATGDAEIIRRMNAPRSPYWRAPWYRVWRFKPRSDNVLTTLSEKRHEELRRKMAPGYSGKELPQMEETIDKHVLEFVALIKRKYISTSSELKPMDLGRTVQYFTLDVISDLAFSSPFGHLVDDQDKFDYIKTTEKAIKPIAALSIYPSIHTVIEHSRLIDLMAPSATDKTGMGIIVGLAKQKVAEVFENEKGRCNMLGSFIKHGLTQDEAESEGALQIMAGSDTTATTIRVFFLYVTSSPNVLSKLHMEITDGITKGTISSPIKDAEARQLRYLQACIKETLRIWPPVTGIMLKAAPPEGDTINGKFIPGGTLIAQSSWAVGRNASVFGPDIGLFRPERWLEASAEQLARMERDCDIAFGYGRSKCLGQPVALLELNKIFVEMLRRFDFSIINPEKPWDSWSAGIFMQKNFWVKVTERSTDG